MTIKIWEFPKSGSSTVQSPSLTKLYGLSGIDDDYIANAYAVSAIDTSVVTPQGILWLQDLHLDHEGHNLWTIKAPYGREKRDTGSFKFSFDTTGGTIHITSSKETKGKYAHTGTAPDNKQAIGVKGDDVEGVDIVIPALKLTYSFRHPAGIITEAKARYLGSVTGMTNSAMWHGFQPGELLLLGCTGSSGTDAESEVSYGMAASANGTLTIGQVANVVKRGHEVLWITFEDVVDGGKPTKQPQYVYVERVYDEVDFFGALGF